GTLNIIREFCRISQKLDTNVSVDWLMKRILFFSYALQAKLESEMSGSSAEADRLAILNQYFFKTERFLCVTEPKSLIDPSAAFRMSRVLNDRQGSPTILAALYAFLGARIGLNLEFVDLKPACFLKLKMKLASSDGQRTSYFIDVVRGGAILS